MIETVEEHCKHEDCVYRKTICGFIPMCGYCLVEGHSRVSLISQCDKYRNEPLERTITWMEDSVLIEWK